MKGALGISGASGQIYALRIAELLHNLGHQAYCIVSENALKVAENECLDRENFMTLLSDFCDEVIPNNDFSSPLASSSFPLDFGVVAPCSLKTLSDIANSRQDTLISRVGGNLLRLRKKVVLLIRETPLSTIDILNMLKASIAGAVIMPASPAFYGRPKDLKEIVDFVVGKVFDALGIPADIYVRWGDPGITRRSRPCDLFYGSRDL
jgi:4-hydroxy-3-polyprenylbenzoate decarboxylase